MKQATPQQEQALIRHILDGRVEEYSYFVTHYQQEVLAFIRRMDVPATEAEELAQDTFVRAYRGLCDFAGKSSFRTWILRIAHRPLSIVHRPCPCGWFGQKKTLPHHHNAEGPVTLLIQT